MSSSPLEIAARTQADEATQFSVFRSYASWSRSLGLTAGLLRGFYEANEDMFDETDRRVYSRCVTQCSLF